MASSRFKVFGRFDGVSEATVVINRGNNVVSVRPLRRHRVYEMRLEDLAWIVIERCVKAEVAEKKATKKVRRKS